MDGVSLRFYALESHRHRGRLVWEWLLDQANRMGIRGGSAFRAMAGFGRHHRVHQAKPFELASELAIEVEFIATREEADRLLALLHREKVRLFYASLPARFGSIDAESQDPPSLGGQ